jgi:hypothetical protein
MVLCPSLDAVGEVIAAQVGWRHAASGQFSVAHSRKTSRRNSNHI